MDIKGLCGVCVLAHFCESHGPNFIFCSQLVTEDNNLFVLAKDSLPIVKNPIPKEKEDSSFQFPDPFASIVIDKEMREKVNEYAQSIQYKINEDITDNDYYDNDTDNIEDNNKEGGMIDVLLDYDLSKLPSKSSLYKTKKCKMCSSIPDKTGFISASNIRSPEEHKMDDNSQFYGISGHYPSDLLFSTVRRISVRALSCEVCPGLEGPLIFSEAEGKFFALSFMFKVKDFYARGNQRCYSLILIHEDCTRLLSSYSVISSHFKKIVNSIHIQAENTFIKDSKSNQSSQIRPERRFQLRSTRGIPTRTKVNLRSLTELLDDKNFFIDLHLKFTNTLTIVNSYISSKSFGRISFDKCHPEINSSVSRIAIEFINSLTESQLLLMIENIVIGNQIIIRASSPADTSLMIEFIKRLLPVECCEVRLYSDIYLESYECNILGIPPNTTIPSHVSLNNIFIIDILGKSKYSVRGSKRPYSLLTKELTSVIQSDLYKYSFNLLIEQIQNIILSWRSKARIYYRLNKSSDKTDKIIPSMLKVLNLTKEDIPSLRFFTTGFRHTMLRVHLWQKIP